MTIAMGTKKADAGIEALNKLLADADTRIVPFDELQLRAACEAWKRYGKGRHPARLNFGDCCTYALAKVSSAKLLYKGNDFGQTDVPGVTVPQTAS